MKDILTTHSVHEMAMCNRGDDRKIPIMVFFFTVAVSLSSRKSKCMLSQHDMLPISRIVATIATIFAGSATEFLPNGTRPIF